MSWIADVPVGWEVKRLKYLGTARNGLTYAPEDVVDEGILVLRSSNIQNDELAFEDNVYVNTRIPHELILQEDDLLICSRNGSRDLIGKCALIDKGTAGNTYGAFMCVYRSLYNRFIHYVLLSDIFNYYLGSFLTSTINQLTNANLLNIEILLPPIPEQRAIADFLDDRCGYIDDIIADLERQMEILRQYKKALITETVTKGLNKSVPMKDSGIDWIGEIPSHWEVKPLKYCASINQNVLLESTNPNYEFRYIDIGSVTFDRGIIDYTETTFENAPSRARRIVRSGDTIISTVRTYLKAIARIEDDDNVIVSTGFAVLSPHQYLNPFYLELFIKSDLFCDEISKQSSGIAYPAINASQLGRIALLIPPSEEQEEIARFLQQKCAETDALITEKQRAIEKMRQYKKSLIYEYVTGKKRVAS